jgi:hypothetical protein
MTAAAKGVESRMPRAVITSRTSLEELAAMVSEALDAAGITATLSGGGAVAIYTENRYQSEDLDFVTSALLEELKPALEPLGFFHSGNPRQSVFEHPSSRWFLEFPPAPLGFGGTYIEASRCAVLPTARGNIRIITPTHSVMDRLIAAASWNDLPALEQAVMVATGQAERLDWEELGEWVLREGIVAAPQIVDFYRKVRRAPPDA